MNAHDFFMGPADPLDVRARLGEWEQRHSEEWAAPVWIEDATDSEGIEVVLVTTDSLHTTHPLDAESVESAVAAYLNLQPPEHRMTLVRSRAEFGGEYALGGDADAGLYLVEPPITVPA
jgi:hypothetical protein